MTRNNWSKKIMDGASNSYHQPQKCYLIKLCHRHLPIGQTLNRRNSKYSPTCPGCREEPETQQHYIQCLARLAWCLKLLAALRIQMENLEQI
jgi:hypothetical protein